MASKAWMEKFEQLKAFRNREGHFRVPMDQDTFPLNRWAKDQRCLGKLPVCNPRALIPVKFKLLDDIGFPWEDQRGNPVQKREMATEKMKNRTGPKHKPQTISKKKFSKNPIRKLPSMAKKTPSAKWMAKYKMLCDFKKKHGHLRVSIQEVSKKDPLLNWIYEMRSSTKSGTKRTLTPEKIRLLNELGFDWFGGRNVTSQPSSEASSASRFTSVKRQMMTEKKKRKKKKINSTGPKKKPRTNSKKESAKIPSRKPQTMAKKKQIGNRTITAKWMAKYKMLSDFKKKHGHIRVSAPRGDKMFPLLNWINRNRSFARSNTKSGVLIPEQKRLLDELGFDWGEGQPSSRAPRVVTTKETFSRNLTRFTSASPFVSAPGLNIGGGIVTQVVIESPIKVTKPAQHSFLSLWAGGRAITVSTSDMDVQLKHEITLDRRTYNLVCRKVKKESVGKDLKKTRIDLTYVATKGPGLQEWNLQQELEKIADFRSLTPTKAVARLELLQTPGTTSHVWYLTANDFEIMSPEEEYFHQGCSYIPEAFVMKLASNSSVAARTESYQVRIIGPKVGIAKGMLMKTKGGDKIRIAPSMLKAHPSLKCKDQWVVLLAKGVYPTNPNINLGKYIDPSNAGGPPESFEKSQPKHLSKMYFTLLKGLGVPEKLLNDYKRRAKAGLKGLKHGHFRGVRDPNGDAPKGQKLPEGTIMLSGFQMDSNGDLGGDFLLNVKKVLVSRSPCLEPSDAKILRVITKKPKTMLKAKWDDLCASLSQFGHIVFSVPDKSKKKSVPLPAIVGEGDLDGDDYFVCWDEKVLQALGPKTKAGHRMKLDEEEQQKRRPRYDNQAQGPSSRKKGPSTWLKEAQDRMLDFSLVRNSNNITGKLYTLSQKIAEESDKGIYDPDARAVARAYKDSLDTMKHGGVVELSSHLREKIPDGLQDYFRWVA